MRTLGRLLFGRISRLLSSWTDFWFDPLSNDCLSLLRWFVGGMLVYTHLVWGMKLEEFFASTGLIPADALSTLLVDAPKSSLWWFVPDHQLGLAHNAMLVVLIFYMLGFLTSLTSWLALAITISNSNRAYIANYGLDQILSVLTLYLAIGGCGGRFSADRALYRLYRYVFDKSNSVWLPQQKTSRARLGTRLIQVHYGLIYFFAGTSKLLGVAWWNGEATWMALASYEYQSLDMTWLAHYPLITELATHATVLFEISFIFLIWNAALKPWLLCLGMMMHLGIVFFLGMPTFGLTMIYGYLAFVSPKQVRWGWLKLRRLILGQSTRYVFAPSESGTTRVAWRILILDASGHRLAEKYRIDLPGCEINYAKSRREFESRLMDGIYTSSIIFWEGSELKDAPAMAMLVERLAKAEIPGVVVVRPRDYEWITTIALSPVQRLLVSPFDSQELQKALLLTILNSRHGEHDLNLLGAEHVLTPYPDETE